MSEGEIFLAAAMICIWIGLPLGRIARALETIVEMAKGRR